MSKFFDAFANIFRIPDLRKRVLFTLGLLAVYRLGGHIPTPGINLDRWAQIFERNSGVVSPVPVNTASRSWLTSD